MALTWVSSSVSDARIIGGNNSNIHDDRGLSDKDNNGKYQVYAYNPCKQEVFADFTFLNDQVYVNHGKCKLIGDRTPGKEIKYTAFTKNGSESNNDTIKRGGVSLQKASDFFKNKCGFDNGSNVRVVELSCPTGTPGKRDRALSSSSNDDDKYPVYACNPCDQEVFADFSFLDNGNDSTVHVNHGKCKSIGARKINKQSKINYTAYTKTGSDIDNIMITRKDVDFDKVSELNKAKSLYDYDAFPGSLLNLLENSSVPDNSFVVELSCPAEMDASSFDDDKVEVYACNPCYQEVFADFNFNVGNGNDINAITVHVNHGKCKSIGTLKNNKDYLIDYTAYTKTGSDIDDNMITRKDVDLDKTESIKEVASEYIIDFPDSDSNLLIPENNNFVILSCPAMLDS